MNPFDSSSLPVILAPAAVRMLPMPSSMPDVVPGNATTSTDWSLSESATSWVPNVVANWAAVSTCPCSVFTWVARSARSFFRPSTWWRRSLVIGPLRAVVPTTIPTASARMTATSETTW